MAFLYANNTINYGQGIQLYNQLQGIARSDCESIANCCKCTVDGTLDCNPPSSQIGEVNVVIDIEDGTEKTFFTGFGSAANGCPDGYACGGIENGQCTPADCDQPPPAPCVITGIGEWDDRGNCSTNTEFDIKSWSDIFWDTRQDSIKCECLSSPLKNIKVTINNKEIYLPIICDSNCDEIETVT